MGMKFIRNKSLFRIQIFYLGLVIFFSILTLGIAQEQVHLPDKYQHSKSIDISKEKLFPLSVNEIPDEQLRQLMGKMIRYNSDLKRMLATIKRLRAEYAIARSVLYPAINLGSSVGATRNQSGDNQGHTSYQIVVPVSYEIDVWRRLSAQSSAALFKSEAAVSDREALHMTLMAELMERYYSGLCLRKQLSLLNREMSLALEVNKLLRYKYEVGLVSKDDVYLAEQKIKKISALRASAKAELSRIEHALKLLVGEYPEDGWLKGDFAVPDWLQYVPQGLPSDLLLKRPDLRSLKLRSISAEYRALAVKRAALPSFKVVAQGQSGSDQLENLNTDTSPSTTPSFGVFLQLNFPIFDGHHNKAAYEAEIYAQQELSAEQKQTLLAAFGEVENALSGGEYQANAVLAIQGRNASIQRQVELVKIQYEEGIKDYLQLASEKENLVFADIELKNAELDLISYRIQLIRSLGGSWWRIEDLHQVPIPK